jgi:peptidoglycan L-alanyl-D-glutamate endopeptidase CwlK
MRDKSLDHLAEPFRTKVFEFLARLIEAKIPVYITETLRSEEQHQADLKAGVSWIQHSKHQDGLAIDIVPILSIVNKVILLDWNSNDSVWQDIGEIGEKLGLVWGGRWTQKDMGHFEMAEAPKGEKV